MRGVKLLPLLVIAGLAWFLFVSDQGSRWFASKVAGGQGSGVVIGKIVSAEGEFKRVQQGGVEDFKGPLSSPLDLHDGDRLETNRGSKLVLLLNSQDEMEMGELSALTAHSWNPADPAAPIYLQWMNGELNSIKPGMRSKAFVVRDGRLYFPGQKPGNKALALTVLKNAPLDLELADQSETTTDFESDKDDGSDEAVEKTADEKSFGAEPDTLSNEYIDEMIVSRQSQLQKCWLSRLKENPNLKGQITLQFDISRRGKVRDLRVTDSTIEDDVLKRCVVSVVERIPFRSYKGQEISLSYPINFE